MRTLRKSQPIGKIAGEVRTYPFEFDRFPEIVDGATISSAAVSADSGLTVAVASTSSDIVNVTMSGGVAGQQYEVTCLATLNDGTTKIGIYLDVYVE
jgi:hypothetical protein